MLTFIILLCLYESMALWTCSYQYNLKKSDFKIDENRTLYELLKRPGLRSATFVEFHGLRKGATADYNDHNRHQIQILNLKSRKT